MAPSLNIDLMEIIMRLEIKDIISGSLDGMDVWVCDYRPNGPDKKPIRNLSPRRVKIVPKETTRRRIYYSESCFQEYGKNGLLQKFLPVFDNTGFRSYTGEPLQVFDDEVECVECWNKLMDDRIDVLLEERETALSDIDRKIENFKQLRVEPKE